MNPTLCKLKYYALSAANHIGLKNPKICKFENDFIKHINKTPQGQSGIGNPFSPIVFVGNELAYDPSSDGHLDFIFNSINKFWSLYLDDKPLSEVSYLMRHWVGLKSDIVNNKKGQKFYRELKILFFVSGILKTFPFIYAHTQYYPPRKGRHYWIEISNIIQAIIINASSLRGQSHSDVKRNFTISLDNYFLSYCFLCEASLAPSKTTSTSLKLLNPFLKYLVNISTPKVLICGSHIKRQEILQLINLSKSKIVTHYSAFPRIRYAPIEVIKTNNRKLIILTRNLSGGIPKHTIPALGDIIIKEAINI